MAGDTAIESCCWEGERGLLTGGIVGAGAIAEAILVVVYSVRNPSPKYRKKRRSREEEKEVYIFPTSPRQPVSGRGEEHSIRRTSHMAKVKIHEKICIKRENSIYRLARPS